MMPRLHANQSRGTGRGLPEPPGYVVRRNLLEVGLAGLKGRVQLVPGETTQCEVFLRSLFVSNRTSASNFKHLVHNPFHEDDEDVAAPNRYHSVSKKSQLYLGE